MPESEGVTSNCVELDGDYADRNFTFHGADATTTAIFGVCFWSETGQDLACFCATSQPATDPTCLNRTYVVPDGAARFSVFALHGALLTWTLEIA